MVQIGEVRNANVHHHRKADDLRRGLEIAEWISHPKTLPNANHRLRPFSPDTAIRYYEDIGLMSEPRRAANGSRIYAEENRASLLEKTSMSFAK